MIIDIYTHILPDKFFREMSRVSPKLENIGARLRGVKKLFDLDLRFAEMDALGDYAQVISLPNPPLEEIAEGLLHDVAHLRQVTLADPTDLDEGRAPLRIEARPVDGRSHLVSANPASSSRSVMTPE